MAVSIVVIVFLIAFSAFFSASETALTSVSRLRLRACAESGDNPKTAKKARLVLKILERFDKALTTILIGNNIVNITTSSLATLLVLSLLPPEMGERYGALISTASVTIIVLIFGEILPKTIAKSKAESFSLAIGGVMAFLMAALTPLSAFFLLLQKLATRLFCRGKKQVSVTEQELMHMIDEIEDDGVIEEQEGFLVRNALEFDETTAGEIITPRVKVIAVSVNDDTERLRELFYSENYSRLPVYERSIDHIIGMVNQKDFARRLLGGGTFYVRDVMQDVIYVPALMKLSEVFKLMQKQKIHLAVVLDQYGGTQGIVTMEDVIEELVGEIWDESDEITDIVRFIGENTFEVRGDVLKNDFNRYFEKQGMDFEINTDANTVGGWVTELFGRIPEAGDVITTVDFRITVMDSDRTIGVMRFEIIPHKTDDE